jgi:hypothetical protein
MRFAQSLTSDEDRHAYDDILGEHSEYLSGAVDLLIESYEAVKRAVGNENKRYHTSVLVLTHHVIEFLDGLTVLIGKGCVRVCDPPLRSALEGFLGVLYILQEDSERRGLAYFVGHCHTQIKAAHRCDPTHPAGIAARDDAKNDVVRLGILDAIPMEKIKATITEYEEKLSHKDIEPVEAEWRATKKVMGREPHWYSLYDGPRSLPGLAATVRFAEMYYCLYSRWSNVGHAGAGLDSIGADNDRLLVRHIRHPDGLMTVSNVGGALALFLANRLIEVYSPVQEHLFQQEVLNLKAKRQALREVKSPWRWFTRADPANGD